MKEFESYSDRALFRSIAGGSEAAFRALFDRYKERFYAAALSVTHSDLQAEEAVQEVFIRVWMRRDTLEEIDSPEEYLFTMIYNHVYSQFRKIADERRVKNAYEETVLEADNATEEFLAAKESQHLIAQAVEKLPPQQKLVYQLSRQEGLTREEIAARLQISPNTVKNHLREAIRYIRISLENKGAYVLSIFFLREF